jgi:alkylation response protein AidB-like acyl-CoA dehydrogenase
VQLHGAMGVTEELDIGAYFKRLLAFDTLFGSSAHHYRRHAALSGRAHA